LTTSSIRVLVVDDYEPWHDFFSKTLRKEPALQIIGYVSDGPDAVQKAKELQPDLILLDIGLPRLNGIEVARQIRNVSPGSKILFVSENRSVDIADEALSTGAFGYVVKSDVGSELLAAVRAVFRGKRFISGSLIGPDSNALKDDHAAVMGHCHEVSFYADDVSLVDGYARFIESALKNGNAVIAVVTDAHLRSLLSRLASDGVNVPAAIEQGSLFLLDAADALSKLTVNDMPDPVRCAKVIGDLIVGAAKGVKSEHGRVAVCGEISSILLSGGNAEGAIELEHLWDKITRNYDVHTLCGYLSSAFPNGENSPIFARICAEHSAAHALGY
jgi:DNA-binding response OmpR family regulator